MKFTTVTLKLLALNNVLIIYQGQEVKGEEAEGPGRTWMSVEEAQKEGMKIDHEREASIIGNLQETAL